MTDPPRYLREYLERTLADLAEVHKDDAPDALVDPAGAHALGAIEDATRMVALAHEMREASERAQRLAAIGDREGAALELKAAQRMAADVETLHRQALAQHDRARAQKGEGSA